MVLRMACPWKHPDTGMIGGWSGEGVDEQTCGDPEGLYEEICKLPRYKIGRHTALEAAESSAAHPL